MFFGIFVVVTDSPSHCTFVISGGDAWLRPPLELAGGGGVDGDDGYDI